MHLVDDADLRVVSDYQTSAIRQEVVDRTRLACLQPDPDGLCELRHCTPVPIADDVPVLARASHTDLRDVVRRHSFQTSDFDLMHFKSRQKFIRRLCLGLLAG